MAGQLLLAATGLDKSIAGSRGRHAAKKHGYKDCVANRFSFDDGLISRHDAALGFGTTLFFVRFIIVVTPRSKCEEIA
jgi:hypothetical protein